jgi:uncharacterized protein (TIGR02391 family)
VTCTDGVFGKGKVKHMAGRDDDGTGMMGAVFSGATPSLTLANLATETGRSIQEGHKFLFMGAMLAFRNPAAHEQFSDTSESEAFELLSFASILMRKLDTATPRPTP